MSQEHGVSSDEIDEWLRVFRVKGSSVFNNHRNYGKYKKQIFISYSSDEYDIANQLKNKLEDIGYKIWFDKEIQNGELWSIELDEVIRYVGCIIVLWSNKSIKSSWVKHEASAAIARNVYCAMPHKQ